MKHIFFFLALSISIPSFSDHDISLNEATKLTIGGYIKADLRNVNGDIAYRDFWVANNVYKPNTNETRFNIRESRLNIKLQQESFIGFIEGDFYDDQQPTGTTETVTGGHSFRLRHAYVEYGDWKVGQTWSTFMPLKSIPEALDFGGAHVGQAFIRQGLIRYTSKGLELAIENPSVQSGESQSIPDVIGRYTWKGSWGQVAIASLLRTVEDSARDGGAEGSQIAFNIGGVFKLFKHDDLRFSYNAGRPGRYVSPGANISDESINGKIHKIKAYTLAYRHFWNESWRSSLYYGSLDIINMDVSRNHIGINLIKNINKKLTIGVETGRYSTESGSSKYYQLSAKYTL